MLSLVMWINCDFTDHKLVSYAYRSICILLVWKICLHAADLLIGESLVLKLDLVT